jgi:predicted Zn finger-like uncharacterized protein
MRLICPNCDAQYEVDASLVPETGRDVQCADCGHVWFQVPENAILPDEEDEADANALLGRIVAAPPETEPDPEPWQGSEPPQAALTEPDPPALPRAALDDSLLAVLREEADREIRARAEETARAASRGLETQPDLGLDDAPALRIRPRVAPAAAPADADPDPYDSPDDSPASAETLPGDRAAAVRPRPARRELLPDIDRINSTLDASGSLRGGGPAQSLPAERSSRRQGFRTGFLSVLVVAGLAWAVYAQSARITAALPDIAPLVDRYVGAVDGARIGLDGLVRDLLQAMKG